MMNLHVMHRYRRFRALEHGDRWLLVEAILWIAIIKLGFRIVPFAMLRRALARAKRLRARSQPAARRIAWAVNAAAGLMPRRSCLSDALAVDVMLRRRGYPSVLRLGVKKRSSDTAAAVHAHAWVELEGVIMAGALTELDEFNPFPSQAAL